MKRLIEKGYKAKKRPSGHNITSKFQVDRGGAIPQNVLVRGNNESNSEYMGACKELGIKAHPARFPKALPEFFIKFVTKPGDLVLDPFAGSNTTGRAAEDLERRWIVEAKSAAFTAVYDRIREAPWYVLSARKADNLLRELLFDRVFAMKIRGFAQQFRGAELDMHFSLKKDLVTFKAFLAILKQEGQTKVASPSAPTTWGCPCQGWTRTGRTAGKPAGIRWAKGPPSGPGSYGPEVQNRRSGAPRGERPTSLGARRKAWLIGSASRRSAPSPFGEEGNEGRLRGASKSAADGACLRVVAGRGPKTGSARESAIHRHGRRDHGRTWVERNWVGRTWVGRNWVGRTWVMDSGNRPLRSRRRNESAEAEKRCWNRCSPRARSIASKPAWRPICPQAARRMLPPPGRKCCSNTTVADSYEESGEIA
jgi:hypothetical protein